MPVIVKKDFDAIRKFEIWAVFIKAGGSSSNGFNSYYAVIGIIYFNLFALFNIYVSARNNKPGFVHIIFTGWQHQGNQDAYSKDVKQAGR
jgi:hypothetical protein